MEGAQGQGDHRRDRRGSAAAVVDHGMRRLTGAWRGYRGRRSERQERRWCRSGGAGGREPVAASAAVRFGRDAGADRTRAVAGVCSVRRFRGVSGRAFRRSERPCAKRRGEFTVRDCRRVSCARTRHAEDSCVCIWCR